ncbi:MAG TPA: hypothetical protein DDW52_10995 [Planctomycetaceae bacterium]|nr:hypothetical protein [Planctomycetaceae bacterium]
MTSKPYQSPSDPTEESARLAPLPRKHRVYRLLTGAVLATAAIIIDRTINGAEHWSLFLIQCLGYAIGGIGGWLIASAFFKKWTSRP